MLDRCNNPNADNYDRYGGKGTRVCTRWMEFESFYEDMAPRPEGTSLERIDNDKDYCPDNCRWATSREQANNRRNNRIIDINGQKLTMAEWCRKTGISKATVYWRLSNGWNVNKALTTVPHANNNQ